MIAPRTQAELERRCDAVLDWCLDGLSVVDPVGEPIGKPLNGVPPVSAMLVPDPERFVTQPEDLDLVRWGVA